MGECEHVPHRYKYTSEFPIFGNTTGLHKPGNAKDQAYPGEQKHLPDPGWINLFGFLKRLANLKLVCLVWCFKSCPLLFPLLVILQSDECSSKKTADIFPGFSDEKLQ